MKTSIMVYIEPDEVREIVTKFLADKIANMDKHVVAGVRADSRDGYDIGDFGSRLRHDVELTVELEVKQ